MSLWLSRVLLTQHLVPKTTCENGEKSSALIRRRPTASAKPERSSILRQIAYGLSCLTGKSDRHKNLLLTANLNSFTRSGKKQN